MAETQQLIQQAKSGKLSLLDRFKQAQAGGTPNITQPQQPPVEAQPSLLQRFQQAQQPQQQQAPQPQAAPQQPTGAVPTQPLSPEMQELASQADQGFLAGAAEVAADTAYDVGKLAVQAALPTALGVAGGALGSIVPVVGTTLGAMAGSAAGTYLNDMFGIQEADVVDYALSAGFPLAGKAASSVTKAVAKRMPSVQQAQQAVSVRLSKSLDDLVTKDPGDDVVKGAFDALDEMGASIPTAPLQEGVEQLTEPTKKLIKGQLKRYNPEIASSLDDISIVQMAPKELREYRSALRSMRSDLLKSNRVGSTKQSQEVSKLIRSVDDYLDNLANTGDQGAQAIRKANALYRQQETHKDIKQLMNQAIKTKNVGGDLVEEIDVARVWDRIRKIEGALDAGRHSTDKMTDAVIALRDNPQTLQTFKEGLKKIAALTPDKNLLIVPSTGGGMLERSARMASQTVNLGAIAKILSEPFGQSMLEKLVTQTGGRITPSSLAVIMTALRPAVSGVRPENDPLAQQVMSLVGEGKQLVEQAKGVAATRKAPANQ